MPQLVNKLRGFVPQFFQTSTCWSCGLIHNEPKLICNTCELNIVKVSKPCLQCGLSHNGSSMCCVHCLSKPKLWQSMIAPLSYQTPVSQLIHQLKYNQNLGVLTSIMELVEPCFNALVDKPDLIIPVPLHQNRYLERGFNQSLEIAKRISQITNVPLNDVLVERIVDTERQSELKLKQREKNIKNAFKVDKALGNYNHIAIVDDVITSGSTVHELTKQCLKQGVKKVDIWAVARAELQS